MTTDAPQAKNSKKFISFCIKFFTVSLVILVVAHLDCTFAEAYSVTISAGLRTILALTTFWMPFSLTETLVIILPFMGVLLFLFAVIRRCILKQNGALYRFFVGLFCLVLILFSLFIHIFGVCYARKGLQQTMFDDVSETTEKDIYITASILLDIASDRAGDIAFAQNGQSVKPYDFDGLSKSVYNSYSKFYSAMPPVFSMKPVAASELWTYTHISGMYMPFTGESNVNVHFPDYVVAFTACHEAAHQLGIASEDEANFLAFLAGMYSEDPYLCYSACINAVEYLLADLDTEKAQVLLTTADRRILGEIYAYTVFFEQYRNSTAAEAASVINDGYLRSQGVSTGVKSYSQVTKLITAYIRSIIPNLYA